MKTERKHNIIYIILNEVNGKTYIGAHSTNDLDDGYMGSGSALKYAKKKYGIEKFKRTILYDFDNSKEMYEKEAEIVNEDFIKSKFNYNIALGGQNPNTTNYVTVRDSNNNCFNVLKDDPRYLSGELKHISCGYIPVKDKDGNIFGVLKDDPRYLSGELISCNKGTTTVKNKDGNYFNISIDDPRYLSGELKHITTGLVSVKDKDGNTLMVSMDDSRYLSGELKHIWSGRKMTDEHKAKIGKANSIKQKGSKNSQFGTCWIYNLDLKESKKIKKEELDNYLKIGWHKGRKVNFNNDSDSR